VSPVAKDRCPDHWAMPPTLCTCCTVQKRFLQVSAENIFSNVQIRTGSGRLFHVVGPAVAKAQRPYMPSHCSVMSCFHHGNRSYEPLLQVCIVQSLPISAWVRRQSIWCHVMQQLQ